MIWKKVEEKNVHTYIQAKEKYGKRKINPCFRYGNLHLRVDCPFNSKCYMCGKVGHKKSHCKTKARKTSHRKTFCTQHGDRRNNCRNQRKFVYVKINYVNVKMQRDTDSDITIINKATWKANRKSILKRTLKIECGMLGNKLYFIDEMICNIS